MHFIAIAALIAVSARVGPDDTGPLRDIRAVRTMERGAMHRYGVRAPIIDSVRVCNNLAAVTWIVGEGGGMSLYRRDRGRWRILGHGGGAMDRSMMRSAGANERCARVLIPVDPPGLK